VKQISAYHRRKTAVQKCAAKACPRRGDGGFQRSGIAKSPRPAIPFDLSLVDFQDFIKREEEWIHSLAPERYLANLSNVFAYFLCANS
jgi:hypothetical protein